MSVACTVQDLPDDSALRCCVGFMLNFHTRPHHHASLCPAPVLVMNLGWLVRSFRGKTFFKKKETAAMD